MELETVGLVAWGGTPPTHYLGKKKTESVGSFKPTWRLFLLRKFTSKGQAPLNSGLIELSNHISLPASKGVPPGLSAPWTVCSSIFSRTTDAYKNPTGIHLNPIMALTRNETALHSDYLVAAHYLLKGDPFASKLSKEADLVTAFYACIVGILSIIGNGYVLYVALKRKAKLKPPELMTMNLAIFDFGISVAGKPFLMASSLSHRWLFGWQGCRYYGWASFFFGCGSLITMTTISLDRYLKICHLRYGTWLQRQHAFLALIFIWVYATFWATMPLLGWGSYAPEPFGTSCTLNWWLAQASFSGQSFVMSILIFCLILPTSIIVFSYVKIICKVKSSAQEVSRFDARNKNRHIMEMKLTKVAMLICAGFLIAWIPYAVVSVWSAFGEPNSVPITVSVVPTLLAKSSAMYNPIIYQVINCKKPSCFKGIGKRRHYSTSRFYTISVELKDSPAIEASTEMCREDGIRVG